jgi:hypothetical protein
MRVLPLTPLKYFRPDDKFSLDCEGSLSQSHTDSYIKSSSSLSCDRSISSSKLSSPKSAILSFLVSHIHLIKCFGTLERCGC